MRAAIYLRRSTNEQLQADSLIAQEEFIRAWAATHRYEVVAVFADSASGRSIDGREEFLRMIAAVRRGASFETILVLDVTRWGRFENPDEAGYYEFVCLNRGIPVVYINESFEEDTSPTSALNKALQRWIAAEFSRKKSETVRRSKERVTRLGFLTSGAAPYALRRVLVERDGTHVADLQPGEWKALSTNRVKLAPGDPEQVAVLRRMFTMYDGGASLRDISVTLNSEGVPSSRGGKWRPNMVGYMLANPVYVGSLRYVTRVSNADDRDRLIAENPTSDRIVLCPAAHEAIIDRDVFDRVQERRRKQTWRKTRRDLADEIREAYERWGFVTSKMFDGMPSHAHWQTYANRFHEGYGEALEQAYAAQIQQAKAQLRSAIEAHFSVSDFEAGFLVQTLLHVDFKCAWPRARRGGLFWEFKFNGREQEDVTVGLCFTPPPDVRVANIYFMQRSRFADKGPRSVCRGVNTKSKPHRFVQIGDGTHIAQYLQNALYFRNRRAEQQVLAAVAEMPMVNVSVLAKRLGWPLNATRILYKKLLAQGAPVPPPRVKPGRRLDVVCSKCGDTRSLVPSDAMQRRNDLCFSCATKRPKVRVQATCPTCGLVRQMSRSALAAMQNGAESFCRPCALKGGRATRLASAAAQRRRSDAKYAVLKTVAALAQAAMERMPETYKHPVIWSRARRSLPTLRWRDAATGRRVRLDIGCSDAAMTELAASPGAFVGACMDRASWVTTRCDERSDEAWIVDVSADSEPTTTWTAPPQ